MGKAVAVAMLLALLVVLLVSQCNPRSDECQRIFDQYGSTVGAYMEENGSC